MAPEALPRRATIRDVAAAADVSQSTASRALSGNGYVAPAVRLRVHESARRFGYVPDATAQHLRRQVSRTLGLVVTDLANSFYAELASGVARQAVERGYVCMLTNTQPAPLQGSADEATDDTETVRTFVGLRAAGVILTPSSSAAGEFLHRHHIPVVEVDRQFAEGASDAVVVDNVTAAREATAALVADGHRRIALLIDETRWTTGRDRLAGYRLALQDAGLPAEPAMVVSSGWDVAAAQSAARSVLAGAHRPTAVFAVNNVLAEGVWRAATELGLRVPADLSVVSFDDAPWMSMVTPPVTVVAQDVVALGRTAVDVLVDRLAAPGRPARTVVVPYRLVRRGSTGPPPT